MSARAAFRASGAWWFLPVMLALGTVFPLLNNVVLVGYAAADLSAAGVGLSYSGPLLAAMSAYSWRGSARFHAPLRCARSGPSVLLGQGWPLIVLGPIVGCAAVAVAARTLPTDGTSAALLLSFLAVLLACASLGVGLSWALPVVIAVPAAAIIAFVWINVLVSTASPRLHYLAPQIIGFATSSQPARSALIAVTLMCAIVILGVLLTLSAVRWDRTARVTNAALVLAVAVLAVALGWWSVGLTATPLNLLASEPRTTAVSCASQEQLQICLWPESVGLTDEVAAVTNDLNAQLLDWGMPVVTSVSARSAETGVAQVDATPGISRTELTLSLARGYLGQRLGCPVLADRGSAQRVTLLAAASDTDALASYVDPATLDAATAQLPLPSAQIRRWFEAGLDDMRCLETP